MLITKEKIDIKAANKVGMKWLAETYLPAKLERKDWIM
jgi:hypothetical protein